MSLTIRDARVVFMGTPEFAARCLGGLLQAGYQVVAVVTQPDRPKGRRRELTPSPVKVAALEHQLPVLQPERIRRAEAVAEIAAHRPDLIVTAAYGQIVPKSLLDCPPLGCINVHASLLPKYRGGAPIHHAIMNGESHTGVTIMYMAEGLDTGDMISKSVHPIAEDADVGQLFEQLSDVGTKLLLDTLPDLLSGTATAEPQEEAAATYAPNISREQEILDWNRGARELYNQVRGLSPWPVAYTTWNNERLKIWTCSGYESGQSATPGTVVAVDERGISVQTGDGILHLAQVQPAGKKQMSAAQWGRGGQVKVGVRFGESYE